MCMSECRYARKSESEGKAKCGGVKQLEGRCREQSPRLSRKKGIEKEKQA